MVYPPGATADGNTIPLLHTASPSRIHHEDDAVTSINCQAHRSTFDQTWVVQILPPEFLAALYDKLTIWDQRCEITVYGAIAGFRLRRNDAAIYGWLFKTPKF